VYSEQTSIFFKHTHVLRIVDKKRNTLVYIALSDKIIEGSPRDARTVFDATFAVGARPDTGLNCARVRSLGNDG
jgi:catabolite regulation protein CreA